MLKLHVIKHNSSKSAEATGSSVDVLVDHLLARASAHGFLITFAKSRKAGDLLKDTGEIVGEWWIVAVA